MAGSEEETTPLTQEEKTSGKSKTLNKKTKTSKKTTQLTEKTPTQNQQSPVSKSQTDLRNHPNTNSTNSVGEPLTHSQRNTAEAGADPLPNAVDYSTIALFSREASANFARQWKDKILIKQENRSTRTSSGSIIKKKDQIKYEHRQQISQVDTNFSNQVSKLLHNKTIPHILTVIEGNQTDNFFELPDTPENKIPKLKYTLKYTVQGKNTKGHKDNKQSMHFYVRDDLLNVYEFKNEEVPHGTENIPCVGVNYKTEDDQKFRCLVVHTPNKFLGKEERENSVDDSFQYYAKNIKSSDNIIVTGYMGDTNYKKEMAENSSPSQGGILATKDGKHTTTLKPQSSSSKSDTNFMESVPLGDENPDTHRVLQPSTLNYIFIEYNKENTTATDHPSIMTYTAHTKHIKGRNSKGNPGFYQTKTSTFPPGGKGKEKE